MIMGLNVRIILETSVPACINVEVTSWFIFKQCVDRVWTTEPYITEDLCLHLQLAIDKLPKYFSHPFLLKIQGLDAG